MKNSSWGTKRRLMARYDTFADSYTQLHAQEQGSKYALALQELDLDESDHIADFGCGTGLFLTLVRGRVRAAVGLDFSRKQLLQLEDASGIHRVQGDIDSPPFKQKAFGHVFSFTVLHHSPHPVRKMIDLSAYAEKAVICSYLRRPAAEREALDALTRSVEMIMVGSGRSKDVIVKLELDKSEDTKKKTCGMSEASLKA